LANTTGLLQKWRRSAPDGTDDDMRTAGKERKMVAIKGIEAVSTAAGAQR